jgi:hypothetical protein
MHNSDDEELCCNICYKKYEDEGVQLPKSLSCGHTYCLECITAFVRKQCPECREPFSSVAECKPNWELIRFIRRLKETPIPNTAPSGIPTLKKRHPSSKSSSSSANATCDMCDKRATLHCSECPKLKTLCEECFVFRHRSADLATHTRSPWTPSCVTTPMCANHANQECHVFCRQCKTSVCTLCTFGSHKNHDLCVISEEVAGTRARVEGLLKDLAVITKNLHEAAGGIENRNVAYTGRSLLAGMGPDKGQTVPSTTAATSNADAARASIRRYFADIRLRLERKENELLQIVSNCCTTHTQTAISQYDICSVLISQIYSLQQFVRQYLLADEDLYVIAGEDELTTQIRELIASATASYATMLPADLTATNTLLSFSAPSPDVFIGKLGTIDVTPPISEVAVALPPPPQQADRGRGSASQAHSGTPVSRKIFT